MNFSSSIRPVLRNSCYTLLISLGLLGMQRAQAADLIFGHISSITHPSSSFNAKDLRAGIQLAFDAANKAGGINGNMLKLNARDDNLDEKQMVAITSEFVANPNIVGLIGYLNSAGLSALAKDDAFGKAGIAQVSPYQGNANIVQANNVYPFRSGYTTEVQALLNEAQGAFKKNVALVNYNLGFGPSMVKFAQEQAASMKFPVVAVAELDSKPDGDMAGSVQRAVAELVKSKPDAIMVIAAGKVALDFIGEVRKSELKSVKIYSMSTIVPAALVSAVGESAAYGIVLSQATPFPYSQTSKLASEYHRAILENTPNQKPSFAHFEGYIGGKIAIAGLSRSGPRPTRDSLIKALNSLGNFDLGGPGINYSESSRKGWGRTELVIIGAKGVVVR